MKKSLFIMLALAVGISAFAQERMLKSEIRSARADKNKVAIGKEVVAEESAANYAPQAARSVVINRMDDWEDAQAMTTTYDLQSNHFISNRMYQMPNGDVAVTATMSHQYNASMSDRGTGYNYFKDGEWGDQPTNRLEASTSMDARTGWPSIARWGDEGEILINHASMRCWTREKAGEGEWEYRGELPISPAGFPYDDDASWPRIATSGDHHNIIHVIGDIQHSVSDSEIHHYQVYLRSEDAENWEISYGPLAETNEEMDHYSADDYAIVANGHNVAILYAGAIDYHTLMFKSTDDGRTWQRYLVWEDPYAGLDWETDPNSVYTDTLYRPMSGTLTMDNSGTVHVALNTLEMIHDELGTSYSYYYGMAVDGILYWNSEMDGPIQSPDGNPHHAARLWWPDEENPGYIIRDSDTTKWIGFIPRFADYEWDNDKFYHTSDVAADYYQRFYGASGHPALSCDPQGNLACAYSTPDMRRVNENKPYYMRSICLSYRNVDKGYWDQLVDILDEDINFELSAADCAFTNAVANTTQDAEFWFSYQYDFDLGWYIPSNGTQTAATDNNIAVDKIHVESDYASVNNHEAKDVVYNIYPNPATDYVIVKSASDADATITIVNLVGQTVKQFNQRLSMGANTINVDLKSGIYFCTISANGFDKTVKFVVK